MRNNILAIIPFLVLCTSVQSDERTAEVCYQQKDKACLESLFKDVVSDPGPEKIEAMYLLGLVRYEEGANMAEAKETFSMTVMFAEGHKKSQQKLLEIYETHPDIFETTDCLAMESQKCLINLSENGKGDEKRNALYLMGTMMYKTDRDLGKEHFVGAALLGHRTATCILAEEYIAAKNGDALDYHQFIEVSFDCYKAPYKKFNKKYFEKYTKSTGHKAYAHSDAGGLFFSADMVSADTAAQVALELCKDNNKKSEDEVPCQVINIDDTWVKDVNPANLPDKIYGLEQIATKSGLKNYNVDYLSNRNTVKVFAASTSGAWWWRTSNEDSVEVVKEGALEKCRANNKTLEAKYPCEIISVNGEWVNNK